MAHFGITDDELQDIIRRAYIEGYEACKRKAEDDEWLIGQEAIISFLYPKGMTRQCFNTKRRKGEYGEAITGNGRHARARKSELLDAVRRYDLSRY